MTHEQAQTELKLGTPPEVICATCPWDRLCIEPPTVSEQDIARALKEARERDKQAKAEHGREAAVPVQTLVTAMAYGGRANAGQLCPVFALRLRGSDGRQLADSIRDIMRHWGEQA